MRKFILLAILGLSIAAHAQSTFSVTLTWKASTASTATTPGAVTVMRAVGACPASGIGTLTYQTISTTAPAAGPFVDTAVSASTTYCYYIKAVIGGVSSGPSPTTFQAVIPSAVAPPSALGGQVTQIVVTTTVTTK